MTTSFPHQSARAAAACARGVTDATTAGHPAAARALSPQECGIADADYLLFPIPVGKLNTNPDVRLNLEY